MVGDGNAPAPVAPFEALETIEFDASSDLYRAAPRDLQLAHAIGSRPAELGSRETRCELEIRRVGTESRERFGRVVAEGFGLPLTLVPWLGALAGRENWVCVMAFAGTRPVAAGAAYVSGEYAWLGLGATLASHRRLGAQHALLARRLEEASARGARVAVTETGERLPDKPSDSYRNILRAGFQEAYLRQNFLSPPP